MGSVLRHSLGTTSIFYIQAIEILSFLLKRDLTNTSRNYGIHSITSPKD